MKMTFSEVSKQYNIPRSSVYAIFNKLQKEDVDKYNQFVSTVQDRQVLDSAGIAYLLDIRGINQDEPVENRQPLDNSLDSESRDKEEDLISYLRQELDDKKKQYDALYEDHAKLVVSMQQSNENLYELAKNQQILQRELQQYKQLEFKEETSLDTNKTTDRQGETDNLDTKNKKKSFWQRLFSGD